MENEWIWVHRENFIKKNLCSIFSTLNVLKNLLESSKNMSAKRRLFECDVSSRDQVIP